MSKTLNISSVDKLMGRALLWFSSQIITFLPSVSVRSLGMVTEHSINPTLYRFTKDECNRYLSNKKRLSASSQDLLSQETDNYKA